MVSIYTTKKDRNKRPSGKGEKIMKKRPGLWANIRKKRASGRPMAKKGTQAYKKAVSAAKKINKGKK